MKKIWITVLCSVLLLASWLPFTAPVNAATTISDVEKNSDKYTAAQWAVEQGLVQLSGSRFQPNVTVSEQEMLAMIAQLDKNYHFSYTGDMIYTYYADLNLPIYGANNASRRTANATRGQFARLYAAMNSLDLSEVQAVQYLYTHEITKGTTGKKTFDDYAATKAITRGDLVTFLYRAAKSGGIAIEGLRAAPTGKDDSKVTLPLNFVSSNGTVELNPPSDKKENDKSNNPSAFKAVQSINLSTEELVANGLDAAAIQILLKDSYGNDISYDTTLQFKVTSKVGARIVESPPTTGSKPEKNAGSSTTTIFTDGGELNAYIIAPVLTKSEKDIITFELVNNDETKFASYRNQQIEVELRYVPKAEVRISYEVYDPDQPNGGGNITPGPKPLPALPVGKPIDGSTTVQTVPFTPNGIIEIRDYDPDEITFDGVKWENYTNTSGQIVNGRVRDDAIQYENAELRIDNQLISVWLFEQILERMIYGDEQGRGGFGKVNVYYSINSEGRAVYNLQDVMDESFTSQFESKIHALIVHLLTYFPRNTNDLTMIHYDSVKAVKAIFDSLSRADQDYLAKNYKDTVGNLSGYNAKVDSLKESQAIVERPEGMERYTKVIVNVVAPGGRVITDYKGTAEIEFNGQRKVVSFNTNTTDYNKGTGYAGSAVAYFDSIVYGSSTATASLISSNIDPRYRDMFRELIGTPVKQKIFTNYKFTQNKCTLITEIAFVVDQSSSMRKQDPNNFTAEKTKQLIRQIGSNNNIVVPFAANPGSVVKGTASNIANMEGFISYDKLSSRNTNAAQAVQTALNNYTTNDNVAKSMVLITDGKTSNAQVERIIDSAKKAKVKIHTIAVGPAKDVNTAVLKKIASETGGQSYHATDVERLHSAYQAVIDAILCQTFVSDASCDTSAGLFNIAKVDITRSTVIMTAELNENCTNVASMQVRFSSVNGDVNYDLIDRGQNVYKVSQAIRKFNRFDLYNEVIFRAFDQNGNLIADKEVKL
ncbi:VWA domain-containing protein [Metasolibacillus meyeri]|uniref:VWA domain-containing protein n=1 Tax=Metasolibacillus meyeri TaxID=1071052 RepID=A0AAW9NTP7_9BACL|nr:vWA domain-containing protein [Metasolibacillus meyeri]MEC1177578.1 VWA domain-containing protein [Metasolibacillus meyeri]